MAVNLEQENADLKRKLKELEGDLTTAYMAGYHKRDDEVRNLRSHADALAHGLKELLYVYNRLISHGVIETPVATLRYTAKKIAENALTAYRQSQEGQT